MPLHPSSANGLSLSSAIPNGRWFFGDQPRIGSCCSHAEQCEPGDLFVVLDEQSLASQQYIDLAIERGAVGILAERPFPVSVPQFIVDDCRSAFGIVCHALAQHPSQSLRTIGITGTYGKSSTGRLLAGIFAADGRTHASLEANQIQAGGPVRLARWLAESRARSCQFATLEVSSQSLARRQLSGVELDTAVITNIRHEHSDWHGSLRNYQAAKARILDLLKPSGLAVLNADDPVAQKIIPELDVPTMTIGLNEPAELTASLLERHASEQTFLLDAGDESIVIRTHVIGDGHIYNCLTAVAVALTLGIDPATVVRGIERVATLPNRLQRIECGQPFSVFVDSSHTPNALANALHTLRPICKGNIHCLVGVDHRQGEIARAQIGRSLERMADSSVLTATRLDRKMSMRTAHDVLDGFDRPAQAHLMPDRAKAICWTLAQARPGDLVLLAGGTETTGPDDVALCDEDVTRYWLEQENRPADCPWLPV